MPEAVEAFSAHAPDYDATRHAIVPCFEDFYGTAVDLIGMRGGRVGRVLDLGAGTGLLSEAVLKRYPEVELTAVDGSAEMLSRAEQRLPGSVRLVVGDLRDELPGGPWDAVVSALAIHHLEHAEQQNLYVRIAGLLRPGGAFINAEHVAPPADWQQRAGRARWRRAAAAAGASEQDLLGSDEREVLNRCSTVAQQLRWLDEAGLVDGDCFFKHLLFAVMAAWAAD